MLLPDDDGVVLAPVEEEAGQLSPEQRVAAGAAADQVEAGVEYIGGERAGEEAGGEDEADTEAAVHSLLQDPQYHLHRQHTEQVKPGAMDWRESCKA